MSVTDNHPATSPHDVLQEVTCQTISCQPVQSVQEVTGPSQEIVRPMTLRKPVNWCCCTNNIPIVPSLHR